MASDYAGKRLKAAQLKKAALYMLERFVNDRPLWYLKAPWLGNPGFTNIRKK